MSTENIKNLIDSIQIGDSIGTEQSFMAEMEAKLDTKLSEFRQEVSQTLFKESVETDEELDTNLTESVNIKPHLIKHHKYYDAWKKHADSISEHEHDDAVETSHSSDTHIYTSKFGKGKVFAKWDYKKNEGKVHRLGHSVE